MGTQCASQTLTIVARHDSFQEKRLAAPGRPDQAGAEKCRRVYRMNGVRAEKCRPVCSSARVRAEKSRPVYSSARVRAEKIRQAYHAVLADAEKSLRVYQCSAPWAEKLGALYHHRCQALAPMVQREDFLGPYTAFLVHSTVFLGTGKGDPARRAESRGAPASCLVQQTVFLGASRGKAVHPAAFLGACPQPGAKVLLAAPSDARTHQTTAWSQRCFRLTPSSLTSTATKIVAKPTAILGVTISL